jgi:hypothetical protein
VVGNVLNVTINHFVEVKENGYVKKILERS